MADKKRTSASKRVRARKRINDPGVYSPVLPPLALLRATLADVELRTPSGTIGIERALQSAPYELTMDGASSLTLNVIDEHDGLWSLLDVDENTILDEGVTASVGGWVTRLTAASPDGGHVVPLTFIDDVAWRLQRFTTPTKASRGQATRGGFIYRLVDEARRPPLADFDVFIPELNDLQRIVKATSQADGSAGGDPGFADSAEITVKGVNASKKQREVLGLALAEAHRLKASDRVLTAVVMALTQESLAGKDVRKTGNDDIGFLQQGREWISAANTKDVAKAVRAFLLGHEANVGGTGQVKGWKQVHGSLRRAPGDLNAAIAKVQISVGGYSPWEDEAKRTVKAWNPEAAEQGGEYAARFEFARGTSDGRESSWTAIGRLTDEVNQQRAGSWHYWATLNAFGYASDAELRQARPSLTLQPGAPWLIGRPSGTWNANRPITEFTMTVLAAEWGLLPASVVAVPASYGPFAGRWLVRSVRGKIGDPRVEVTLRRPIAKAPEPATEMRSRDTGSSDDDPGGGSLRTVCSRISGQKRDYKLGGGHGVKLATIKPGDPLDCSSSTSLALKRAGKFDGDTAIVSGAFAEKWGKPGKGRDFTVWANGEHVWIEGYDGNGDFAWRFDTSPWGSGDRGPRLRTKPRTDHARFTARHWED